MTDMIKTCKEIIALTKNIQKHACEWSYHANFLSFRNQIPSENEVDSYLEFGLFFSNVKQCCIYCLMFQY